MLGLGSPLAEHMGLHIILMNAAAPAAAFSLGRLLPSPGSLSPLGAAFTLQQAALWFWHAPSILDRTFAESGIMAIMQLSLLAAALWFWFEVFRRKTCWHAILALMLSAKLFCLLGILMTLAPRPLYAGMALADQQLAGLLMLTACPLTYLAVATLLATHWIRRTGAS